MSAGDRAVLMVAALVQRVATIQHRGQLAQTLDCLRLQPAIDQLLDTICESMFEEAPVVGWRFAFKEIAPLLFELRDWQRLQGSHTRQHTIGHFPSLR